VKVLLADANNLAMRAIHAAQYSGMSADGIPTGALLIFINLLSRHIREERPDSVVVCWDGGKSAYRQQIYGDYKANRVERPEDEEDTRPFPQMKEFLTVANIHHVERPGWEADDLIACYWRTIRPLDTDLVILSADKDLLQLVGPHCIQVRPASKPPTDYWDEIRVARELGCRPSRVSLTMALAGDPGDNVPGLPGIGPKRAAQRLAKSNWELETFFSLYEISEDKQAQVRMAYELVDLRNVPYAAHGLSVSQPPVFRPTDPATCCPSSVDTGWTASRPDCSQEPCGPTQKWINNMAELRVKQCDGCQKVIPDPKDVTVETLRYEGKISGIATRRDLCPDCAQKATDGQTLRTRPARGEASPAEPEASSDTEPTVAEA
jgi:5'-3' exonuclease